MVIQEFGTVKQFPIGLSYDARMLSCEKVNNPLADTQVLYSMHQKHLWHMRGVTLYHLNLLLDKQADKQLSLVDALAARVQTLGGV